MKAKVQSLRDFMTPRGQSNKENTLGQSKLRLNLADVSGSHPCELQESAIILESTGEVSDELRKCCPRPSPRPKSPLYELNRQLIKSISSRNIKPVLQTRKSLGNWQIKKCGSSKGFKI